MAKNSIQKQLEITSLDSLKNYSDGAIVQFPDFAENQPFVAKLRRPSMMVLMKNGKIPNALLDTANALFDGKSGEKAKIDNDFFKNTLEVIEVLAEAAFVQPTWAELKDAGIELTDEQLTFLFNYTQKGIKTLIPFRG